MSVNIFGAGRIAPRISENIGEKFKTLSLNLASKLDKSGGVMTGDLLLNSSELRTFGVRDISSGQSTSLLLGDVDNQIRHNYGYPIKITASHGVKFTCSCHIDSTLFMQNNYIRGVHDPEKSQDVATKYYVDNKPNYNGFIPILESNNSCLGFCASASLSTNSATPRFQPFNAFNNLDADGAWVCPSSTGWIQIKCPEAVKVWRVALKARGRDITVWTLTASNNGTDFRTLINSSTVLLGSASSPTFVEVTANNPYPYYRLNITASTGSVDMGIQVFQLYTIG